MIVFNISVTCDTTTLTRSISLTDFSINGACGYVTLDTNLLKNNPSTSVLYLNH